MNLPNFSTIMVKNIFRILFSQAHLRFFNSQRKIKLILVWLILFCYYLPGIYSQPGWELTNVPNLSKTLNSVYFVNPYIGYAVGKNATIIKTTDGGENWSSQDAGGGTGYDLNSVYFLNADTGYIVGWGGRFLKTTNGGNTWTTSLNVVPSGVLNSVFFTDSNNGHIVALNGYILKTIDGGSTWETLQFSWDDYKTVLFTDPNTGYIGGESSFIQKTIDAGNSWNEYHIGAYNSFRDIFFATPDIGYGVTEDEVIKTLDAGETWTEVQDNIYGLRSVFFTNEDIGYIAGFNSADPIILKTMDGGTTWANQISEYIYSGILSIVFTDEYTGTAVGLGGDIFRTFTGGENIDPIQDTLILHSLMDISVSSNCVLPYHSEIYVNSIVSGASYQVGDSLKYQIYFGDGYDTTLYKIIQEDLPTALPCNIAHVYLYPGAYNLKCIATLPNGLSDTLLADNMLYISDNCGTISGTIFLDENGDCIPDEEEYKIPNIPATLYFDDQFYSIDFTGDDGNYSFDIPEIPGFQVVIDTLDIPAYTILCPDGPIYSVENVPSDSLNFALICEPGFDMDAFVAGSGFRPGDQGQLLLNIKNHSCFQHDGWIKIVLDPLTSFINSVPQPEQIIEDTLIWNFSDLSNLEDILIPIGLLTSTDAWVSDTACFDVFIYPIEGDNDTINNIQQYCFPIENSWDPNMKAVLPEGEISPNIPLKYTIHFQNTGTAEAYNISIVDSINSNLDMNSFQLLSSSHPMTMDIVNEETANIIKFNFYDIMLPDSATDLLQSMGYVSFEILPKLDLVNGTLIHNMANIFFDYNPAVATNVVENSIHISKSNNYPEQNTIRIYPNPTTGRIHIASEMEMDLIIYSMLGQKIFTGNTDTNQIELSEKGIYLFEFTSFNNRFYKKVIVQ